MDGFPVDIFPFLLILRFLDIVKMKFLNPGCGRTKGCHNKNWVKPTRRMLESNNYNFQVARTYDKIVKQIST